MPNRRRNEIQQIIDKANALDRRRQAQIANQAASIDRLLKLLNERGPGTAAYSEEMRILHQAAAALVAERDEAREALAELVRVLTLDGASVGAGEGDRLYAEALSGAQSVLGAQAG